MISGIRSAIFEASLGVDLVCTPLTIASGDHSNDPENKIHIIIIRRELW
jgi:hypothetical protein